jgi:hypothetical protein
MKVSVRLACRGNAQAYSRAQLRCAAPSTLAAEQLTNIDTDDYSIL